jgi:hypothetical protein
MMRSKGLGLMVMGILMILFVSFGVSWAAPPTRLYVVVGQDGSLYKMTCDGGVCSSWQAITGYFASDPSVIWDPALGRYVLLGIGLDGSIWSSTFNVMGVFQNDWVQLPGATSFQVGSSGGPNVIAWARINADGTVASCLNCNASGTSLLLTGRYQVDFTLGDITGVPRSATIDDLGADVSDGIISVADRFGVASAVFVHTTNNAGVDTNLPFTLVLYNY